MSHIFISYSRSDLAVVDQIAAAMIEKLIPIWMDRVGITGGDQWRRQIVEAIEDCDAFLLVLSNSAVVSDNVRKEVDLAEHFNKRIIPVEIEVTDIPRELSYQLIGIQRIDMIDDTAGKLPNLLSLLVQFHQSIQHPATDTAPEVSPAVSEVPPAMPVPSSIEEMTAPDVSIQDELDPEPPTTLPDEEKPAADFEPISAATAAPSAASITADPGTAVPGAPPHQPTQQPEKEPAPVYSPPVGPQAAPILAAPEPVSQDAQSVETSFFKRLPLAAWLGGAAGLVVIVALILGLSGVFGGGEAQQAAQPTMEAALLVESTATEPVLLAQTETEQAIQSQAALDENAQLTAISSTEQALATLGAQTATEALYGTQTAAAIQSATSVAGKTATVAAKEARTAVAASATARTLLNTQKATTPRLSPRSGELAHDPDDGLVSTYSPEFKVKDFIVEVRFYNPFHTSFNRWDYGLFFRDLGKDKEYRLVIFSNKSWELLIRDDQDESTTLQDGVFSKLDTTSDGSNFIRLVAEGNKGFFYLNDEFIAELDISAFTEPGWISVGTGFYNGREVSGYTTKYEDFTVWDIE